MPTTVAIQAFSKVYLCWFWTSLPLHRVITPCCFMVTASQQLHRFGLSPGSIAPELKSTVCDLPQWAKQQGCPFIGKTLLAAWSSLCGMWHLRSYTNIIIKAAKGKLVWKQHEWFHIQGALIFFFFSLILFCFFCCSPLRNPFPPKQLSWNHFYVKVEQFSHKFPSTRMNLTQ